MPSPVAWLSMFSLLTLMLVPELLDVMPGRSAFYAKARSLAGIELVVPCLPGPFASVALNSGPCSVNAAEEGAPVLPDAQESEMPASGSCAVVPAFRPPCPL
ncbi:hypothetical protein [Cupriavidus oxalaticus]|uniref:hypothetical protein n=1 Tax=Cupriavidus oxalaticus TaxID=96344 RepID=UPI00316E6BCC